MHGLLARAREIELPGPRNARPPRSTGEALFGSRRILGATVVLPRHRPAGMAGSRAVRARFILVAACLGAGGCDGEAAKPAAAAKTEGPRPAKVVLAPVRAGAVVSSWSFPGEVRARARASLAAGAAGAVERVTVEIGDRVDRGQLLVEVDPALAGARWAVARARLTDAEENVAQAEREAKRLAGLAEGVVPEQEREQARSRRARAAAELEARRAEVLEARAELDLHRVRAPFDGVVTDRLVDRGDWVRVGDPALEVVSTGEVDILVDASRALLGKVRVGDKAQLVEYLQAPLRVAGVVPALDPATRTLRVRLEPAASLPEDIVPGASVEVVFSVKLAAEGGVVVPEDALLFDGQRTRLVEAVDGQAVNVDVEVLARSGREALVKGEGLREGDQVVIRGNERVRPGQPLDPRSE